MMILTAIMYFKYFKSNRCSDVDKEALVCFDEAKKCVMGKTCSPQIVGSLVLSLRLEQNIVLHGLDSFLLHLLFKTRTNVSQR